MGRPVLASDDDQLERIVHKRNVVCSRNLLDALKSVHAPEPETPEVESEPLPVEVVPQQFRLMPGVSFAKLPYGKVETIQRATAMEFAPVSLFDIRSPRRNATTVLARQVAMYISKMTTSRSLPEIGRLFGRRDHTTVLHAVRKIELKMQADLVLAERVYRIIQSLEAIG